MIIFILRSCIHICVNALLKHIIAEFWCVYGIIYFVCFYEYRAAEKQIASRSDYIVEYECLFVFTRFSRLDSRCNYSIHVTRDIINEN